MAMAMKVFKIILRQGPSRSRGPHLANHQLLMKTPAARNFVTVPSRTPPKRKAGILLTAGVVGSLLYMAREPPINPQLKHQLHLLELATESAAQVEWNICSSSFRQGDVDRAAKYHAESYAIMKDLVPPGIQMAEMCRLLGGMTEELGKYAAALSYYRTAMKNAKLVTPISRRCFVGVDILDRIAECYSHLGKFEDAERTFNKAIKVYEKYQGHASLSQPGRDNDRRNQALMEIKVMHVYLHYAQTLNLMDRSSEVSLIRQRLVQLLQGSPMLRGEETHVLDQFDDILTRQRQLLGGGNKGSDKSV